jgi:hypothetical protein
MVAGLAMENVALVIGNVEVLTPFTVHEKLVGVVGIVMVTVIWAEAGAAASTRESTTALRCAYCKVLF